MQFWMICKLKIIYSGSTELGSFACDLFTTDCYILHLILISKKLILTSKT